MESKLPKEIKAQIESEAKKAAIIVIYNEYDAGPVSSARTALGSRIDPIQKEFYIKGATAWAPWFVKHNAIESELVGVRAENERLKGWKVKYDELQAEFIDLGRRYNTAQATLLEQAKEHQRLKERADKMEAALEWIKTYGPDQSKEGQAFIDKALKGKDEAFSGSKFTSPTPGITLGCISPEARDLLDSVMEAWEKHYKDLKETSRDNEPTFYGFAYWLIRWSGLVQPNAWKEGKEVESCIEKEKSFEYNIRHINNNIIEAKVINEMVGKGYRLVAVSPYGSGNSLYFERINQKLTNPTK